jgi:hypothetical protein
MLTNRLITTGTEAVAKVTDELVQYHNAQTQDAYNIAGKLTIVTVDRSHGVCISRLSLAEHRSDSCWLKDTEEAHDVKKVCS